MKSVLMADGGSATGRFADGSRIGPWTLRYPDKSVFRHVEYSNGELAWDFEEWFPSGKPKAKGRYLSGEKIEPWQFWDSAGVSTQKDFGDPLGRANKPLQTDGASPRR